MKGFLCFIVAAVIYFILGIIAWNVVCSVIEVGNKTVVELADYRLSTYSGIAIAISYCAWAMTDSCRFASRQDYDAYEWIIFIVAGVNLVIAIAVDHWESVWEVVANIFTFVYNIVNIGLITLFLYIPFSDKK